MDKLVVILGPTASGKTKLATALADNINGAIISADSRQVYKHMDIGTGKDLKDFNINGKQIPYYLIDICEPGEKYNLAEFQKDAEQAIQAITQNGQTPILCGGTGLYIEALLNNYKHTDVAPNEELRKELLQLSKEELTKKLEELNVHHKTFDTSTKKRLIRAIEILTTNSNIADSTAEKRESILFGIDIPIEPRRERITQRLLQRLNEGMIDEVKDLLEKGVKHDTLQYYGLEYKYISLYLLGELSYDAMVEKLNTEIHRFAKRQMTWFRRMERNGFQINWIPFDWNTEKQIEYIQKVISISK